MWGCPASLSVSGVSVETPSAPESLCLWGVSPTCGEGGPPTPAGRLDSAAGGSGQGGGKGVGIAAETLQRLRDAPNYTGLSVAFDVDNLTSDNGLDTLSVNTKSRERVWNSRAASEPSLGGAGPRPSATAGEALPPGLRP